MSAGEHDPEDFAALERELASLRPAGLTLGGEEVIGMRLNEELEVAFIEALSRMRLRRPSSELLVGLERDLSWEFRLEDQLRGLPLRRPTVALGRAVEVQVNLRALRRDEVVVPFPVNQREEALERGVGGRGWGWLVRWGIAAALVVSGFGMGWKMARDAARELGAGVVAGRFESEAARATARMAVGAGWEPAGVPLPEGVENERDQSEALQAGTGAGPSELKRSGGGLRSFPDQGARSLGPSVARGADSLRGAGGGEVSPALRGVGGAGGIHSSGTAGEGGGGAVASAEQSEAVGPFVVNGRLAARLASSSPDSVKPVAAAPESVRPPVVASVTSATPGGAAGAVSGVSTASPAVAALSAAHPMLRSMEMRGPAVGVVGDEVSTRSGSGSRILDAVGQGDLASVIPVEILTVVEGGVALKELQHLGDGNLPLKGRFTDGDGGGAAAGSEVISVNDLASASDDESRDGLSGAERLVGSGRFMEAPLGFLREGQLVYVADDDELRMEIGKGFSGGLVARFERLDGHFLAADEVQSALDLERLANRAKGVLSFLPGSFDGRQGPALPVAPQPLPATFPGK
jgi:hypothetical protein